MAMTQMRKAAAMCIFYGAYRACRVSKPRNWQGRYKPSHYILSAAGSILCSTVLHYNLHVVSRKHEASRSKISNAFRPMRLTCMVRTPAMLFPHTLSAVDASIATVGNAAAW